MQPAWDALRQRICCWVKPAASRDATRMGCAEAKVTPTLTRQVAEDATRMGCAEAKSENLNVGMYVKSMQPAWDALRQSVPARKS